MGELGACIGMPDRGPLSSCDLRTLGTSLSVDVHIFKNSDLSQYLWAQRCPMHLLTLDLRSGWVVGSPCLSHSVPLGTS